MNVENLMTNPDASPFCSATSKRTRKRCHQRVPGGGVCRWHGGAASQVQVRQEARVALAEAKAQRLYAADFEERDPGDVLMATVADIDSVVQRLKRQAEESPSLTAQDLVLLRDWLELAAKWSSVVLNGRLDERRVRLAEAQGRQVVQVIQNTLARVLDYLVAGGLSPDLRAQWTPMTRSIVLDELRALQESKP